MDRLFDLEGRVAGGRGCLAQADFITRRFATGVCSEDAGLRAVAGGP
jgi:hypothetical protein